MNNKVSIGPTTIIGWTTAFLALVPTIIRAVEEGKVAFTGPEKYLAIFGIASGLITNVARYLQAHKLIGISTSEAISEFVPAREDIPAPGTSIADASSPIGVIDAKDSPNVPLSGA
jgi:hypothetical protein